MAGSDNAEIFVNVRTNDRVALADAVSSDFIPSGVSAARGLVPPPPTSAGATLFLREDATWAPATGATAAPVDAEYLVAASTSLLSAERLVVSTSSIEVDFTSTGLARFNQVSEETYIFVQASVTNVSVINITELPSDFNDLEIIIPNLMPQVNAAEFNMRFAINNTFVTTASTYLWAYSQNAELVGVAGDVEMRIMQNAVSASQGSNTHIWIENYSIENNIKTATWLGASISPILESQPNHGFGRLFLRSSAINGVQFYFTASSIAYANYIVKIKRY